MAAPQLAVGDVRGRLGHVMLLEALRSNELSLKKGAIFFTDTHLIILMEIT